MTTPPTCDTVRTALLEGGPDTWVELEPHLARCPDCAALKADILAAEANLDRVLDDFAERSSFDAALAKARSTPTPTSWRLPIMSALVLASAAAAAIALAPWSSPAPIDATVGVDGAATAQPRDPEPTAAREDAPAPVPVPPVTPSPPPTDGLATADDAPAEPADVAACGDLVKLEPQAMVGKLDEAVVRCLADQLAPDSSADAEPVLILLTVNAFAAGDMETWERHALQLASITEDPNIHYKLALFYSRTPDDAPASLHHADVALAMVDYWPEPLRTRRAGSLLKLRAGAALRMHVDAPDDDTRAAAAEAARRWFRHDGLDRRERKDARKACEAVATTAWCEE